MSKDKDLTLSELKESSYKDNFDDILLHLRDGLMRDYTIEEACCYAGINRLTYYRWLKKCNKFARMMEKAKSYVSRMAKKNIAEDIAKRADTEASMWWLKHRRRKLYSTRNEMSGPDGDAINVTLSNFKDISDEDLEDLEEEELQKKLSKQARE